MTDNPPRMFFSEVSEVAKLSKGTLRERIKCGTFPAPIDRGKEYIFSSAAVYNALGMRIPNEQTAEDRLLQALETKHG